ncbi:MAG: hypothetical protein JSW33_04365 [bacterium]|nr:MAG: hypothetical protein JSW33_04365 [bacterium]
MTVKILFIIILGSMFSLTCERYINSQIDSNLNDREIIVSGTVVNEFTGDPIKRALVNFGGRDTLTDHQGYFKLPYRLTADNDRNKPVEMTVIADNYFNYKSTFIIAPIDYTLLVSMTYAAPIIINSVLVRYYFSVEEMDLIVIQALLFDYQGADDIDSVVTTLYYQNERSLKFRTSKIPMRFVEKISQNAAHYQAVAIPNYQDIWNIQNNFDVYVVDSQGYSSFIQDVPLNPFTGDTLIFPPVFYMPKMDSIFSQ